MAAAPAVPGPVVSYLRAYLSGKWSRGFSVGSPNNNTPPLPNDNQNQNYRIEMIGTGTMIGTKRSPKVFRYEGNESD